MTRRPDPALAPSRMTSRAEQDRAPSHDPVGAVPPALLEALRIVGPALRGELLGRLTDDLHGAAEDLGRACGARDLPGLSRAAHVLTSLLGTVGDAAAIDAVARLRLAAASGDWDWIDRAAQGADRRVAGLLRDITRLRAAATVQDGARPPEGRAT